jgi:hypothetical protein
MSEIKKLEEEAKARFGLWSHRKELQVNAEIKRHCMY